MIGNIARKQTRIGVLVQEKFALQLLYQRNAHHSRQNILNLQGQILALQNNPSNIQQIGMVGYGPPNILWTSWRRSRRFP